MSRQELDERLLDILLAELEQAREWSPRVMSKLESLLRGDEESLFRVNPLAFATERGLAASESIDLFLHATHVGLLEMTWSIVCPVCGQAAQSFATLRTLTAHYSCGLCQMGAGANLDDYIQVAFTVSPKVRSIRYHRPETLPLLEYFVGYRFVREAVVEHGQWVGDLIREYARGCEPLRPGEVTRIEFEAASPELHATDANNDAGLALHVKGTPTRDPQALHVRYNGGRFDPTLAQVRPGPVSLEIEHVGTEASAVLLLQVPEGANVEAPLVALEPFLTGGMLLANPTFRRLFRSETIQSDEGIGVRDVTLLFTDLTGSTELYERIGDLQAFALVRQHFDQVGRVVEDHGGAVVKTIGDAVMAVFLDPASAVQAALDMIAVIEGANEQQEKLILKAGLHRGPSIAVTLNNHPDYFGQTVNIAARVQDLAGPSELWLSDDVYHSPGVCARLEQLEVSAHDAQLKGIEKSLRVYRMLPNRG